MGTTPPTFVENVLKYWIASGIPYPDGVSEQDLDAFERRSGLSLPPDMGAFYRAANGLPDGDDRNICIATLSELRRMPELESMLPFADVEQYAWHYAIELDGAAPYKKGAVYAVANDAVEIASSLAVFFDLYISNDERLYPIYWHQRGGDGRDNSTGASSN